MFNHTKYCFPVQYHEYEASDPVNITKKGLHLLLLANGRCAVQQENCPSALAQGGQIIITALPTQFIPMGICRLIGVSLVGIVATDFALEQNATRLLESGACPAAPDALVRLVTLQKERTAAETAALSFSLLCLIADANTQKQEYPRLAADAMAAIRQNYADLYGVDELAQTLGISKSHLVRSFKAATGITPGQYLTQIRLDAAKQLLLHREYPLEIVASLCGFSGANYLCKVFKKEIGITPAQYRATHLPQQAALERTALEDMLYF
ncbi:MAG: AraC family transcriptional regulator [Oscillospiraceae bacterium]|nr:AraC family transcriptional regulator [Oscillospiraceae bacterium]